mmetsp:Transcript_5601/g.4747  ORF Transcript_5601/g.4747 Transcript_5601/m.4747 type:complete len:115 (-) Transcript_5601:205-549(-)
MFGIGAVMYLKKRKYEQALDNYLKSLFVGSACLKDNHPFLGKTYQGMATAYAGMGRSNKALTYIEKAFGILREVYGEDSIELADCYHTLGNAYRCEGRYEEALQSHTKALQIKT